MTDKKSNQPVLTDEEILAAIAASANFNESDTVAWRPESLALGRAIETALLSEDRNLDRVAPLYRAMQHTDGGAVYE